MSQQTYPRKQPYRGGSFYRRLKRGGKHSTKGQHRKGVGASSMRGKKHALRLEG